MELPLPQNDLELRICSDPDWIRGMHWGKPRPAHPEGTVAAHTIEVLTALSAKHSSDPEHHRRLRLIALVHDVCKVDVDQTLPLTDSNDHSRLARKLAERYIDDEAVLVVIQYHDDAYRTWLRLEHAHQQEEAEHRLNQLIEVLVKHDAVRLYIDFMGADTCCGDKDHTPLAWFWQQLTSRKLFNQS